MLTDGKLVLASSSPRRRMLLEMVQADFTVVESEVEEVLPEDMVRTPAAITGYLAGLKAEAVHSRLGGGSWVLGADTMVATRQGEILGKPRDREDAARMLRMLAGQWHDVFTGVCLIAPDGQRYSGVERSGVLFAPMSDEEIEEYIATGEPMDKAGAYGIQGVAALYIERVDGDYCNVVGLPLRRIKSLLDAAQSRGTV